VCAQVMQTKTGLSAVRTFSLLGIKKNWSYGNFNEFCPSFSQFPIETADEDSATPTVQSGGEGQVKEKVQEEVVAPVSTSMMTLWEPLQKYKVMLVLFHLEMQFKKLENGHRASMRLYMKQKVNTSWIS
jgi:hypothetical protein